jgi:hypothetical protein
MTFSCPNYDYDAEGCRKLRVECIPGRPGGVLKGKIKVSEDIEKRLRELEKTTARRKGRKRAVGNRLSHT